MDIPSSSGPFHIIGIGGIGMSAIAEVLSARGFVVQGSDMNESANVARLRNMGIRVFIGHDAINLIGARNVVVSTAIKADNPELMAAREKGISIVSRANMLSELMRGNRTVSVTGTHGKTTTTSMIGHLFEHAGVDPTVVNGGIIEDWGSNARLGKSDWMIVEADESDGTFTHLPSEIGVVTNIDAEHLDYYGSLSAMHDAFRRFFRQIPFYGALVTCIDHPVVRQFVEEELSQKNQRLITYGRSDDADVRLINLISHEKNMIFDVEMNDNVPGGARRFERMRLPMPGEYNVINALAAMAVAAEAGIEDEKIIEGLMSFGGISRRFTPTGQWNGVSFYDDYAHHPVEISAVLNAAKDAAPGRLIAIVQPHRYSRLKELFAEFCRCFGRADMVIVAPVFAAGEAPIEGADHIALSEGIQKSGHGSVMTIDSEADLAPLIDELAQPGDLVIGLGAGSISQWSHGLPRWLEEMPRKAQRAV